MRRRPPQPLGAAWEPGDGADRLVLMSQLKLTGLHNAANALAALAMCDALGLPAARCIDALTSFPGLAHRSQWVADIAGVRYVDDSKGTNVGATLAAVAGMAGSLVLIAGGQGKGQDFAPLAHAFRGRVRHVVLIGQDAQALDARAAWRGHDRIRAATWMTPYSARPAQRAAAKPYCCRRRARAWTCFATMAIAATCSPRQCDGCNHERRFARLRTLERPTANLRLRRRAADERRRASCCSGSS